MSVETAIRTRLTTHTGTAALIVARVYPHLMPQDVTLPAITYSTISRTTEPMFGYSNSGVWDNTMQIDCWAVTYAGAKALADQVRLALTDWHQDSSEVIWRVSHQNEAEMYESDTALYRVSLDFGILSPAP